ncbi:MAG TPA: DUF2207 domain-containing protein, partial [Candidatus Omnitrophota bacterium]|nr:DUF2207 domain-containing protein [Candidatus Omnitrophota bacterium]
MRARNSIRILMLGMVAFFAGALTLCAQNTAERITSFSSSIRVHEDSTMTVTETITVQAAGENIRHGIYRDFPTRYKDYLGNTYVVDFQVRRVFRDGLSENFWVEPLANGKRVYIGSKHAVLSPGEYTYILEYQTNRQLGFFRDHDELYWNVTGNGWGFEIEKAQAVIELPGGARQQVGALEAFTGPQGARGRDYVTGRDAMDAVTFSTSRPLQPGEGLTIVVAWPKGFVREPDLRQKAVYFFRDNLGSLVGFIGLLAVLAYYLIVWAWVGKDPARGTIIPLYNPPAPLDPAAVRYIMRMGFDQKSFAAEIINIAVKGYITIDEANGGYMLKKTGRAAAELNAGESLLCTTLFGSRATLMIAQENHSEISHAIAQLKQILKNNYEKSYFLTNIGYFAAGAVISAVVVGIAALLQASEKLPIALFMSVWLTGWSVGVTVLLSQVVTQWKIVLRGGSGRLAATGGAIFMSLFALPFLAGEIFGLATLVYATSATVVLILFLAMGINALFYHLLKSPTLAGRKVMDKIEGFKMFLEAAEKDRMKILYQPTKTPELFEKYLPYALALDVEQAWAEQFAGVLDKAATAEGKHYSPAWYAGAHWSNLGAAAFVSSLGSSFAGAISAASHAPGSSSGS